MAASAASDGAASAHPASVGSDGAPASYVDSQSAPGGHPDKRAARIAREIEADVIASGWPVGALLGSEQSLQDRFGVSRSVLREAVRLVEHHQVARTRRGPNGGLFVTAPDAVPATRALVVYLEYIGASLDELLDARLVLEPLAAALAARRIDDAGIARLNGIVTQENGQEVVASWQRDELHLALSALSGNPVLHLFVDVLIRLTGGYADLSQIGAVDVAASAALARTQREHTDVVEAVVAGDGDGARDVSQRHIESFIGWLHEHHEPAMSQVPVIRPDGPGGSRGKLAEQVAAAIRADIVASGWQVGSVVGTEGILLERYGVSRSAFREAVRLLEHHCVARMRRGPGGGLVVTAPEAQASIDTIALYLEYRQPSRNDLTLVRDLIEVEHVARVAKRSDDVAVQNFLAAGELGIPDISGVDAAEFRFHMRMAQLAGNRVLELFLTILVELFRRQWLSQGMPVPETRGAVEVAHAHARILEAVAKGDEMAARQRMSRHLEALTSWWV